MERSIVGLTAAMVHYFRRPPHSISPRKEAGRGDIFSIQSAGDGPLRRNGRQWAASRKSRAERSSARIGDGGRPILPVNGKVAKASGTRRADIGPREQIWKSSERAKPGPRAGGLVHRDSPHRSSFSTRSTRACRARAYVRTGRTHGLAYLTRSTRTLRPRTRQASGLRDGACPALEEIRPGDVVWFGPRGETPARGLPGDRDDAHRDPGSSRDGKGRRLDGEGRRRQYRG